MKKKIFFTIVLLFVINLFVSNISAECYERTCPTSADYQKYTKEKIENTTCTYKSVDDYYCRANECAIDVTNSGTSINCGRCGYTYDWDNNTKRCDISEYHKQMYTNAECAEKAKESTECTQCKGYYWNSNTSSCIPEKSSVSSDTYDCRDYNTYTDKVLASKKCIANTKTKCVWNKKYNYCNVDTLLYVACGDTYDIPYQIPQMISLFVKILKIGTPIILILVGMISLLKASAASKEDEIKKAQSSLIKKIISAVIVFFVITIVQFVMSLAADSSETDSLSKCFSCFLGNDCSKNIYYKTNVAETTTCTYLSGDKFTCPENNEKK